MAFFKHEYKECDYRLTYMVACDEIVQTTKRENKETMIGRNCRHNFRRYVHYPRNCSLKHFATSYYLCAVIYH
jgi:hypothetical protein